MDSLINAAARLLAAGDPLAALKLVALRNDASGLALRGIALAQLGEHQRARELLRVAARAFGAREPVARARCVVAEAEIALASRDLGWAGKRLHAARAVLDRHGDALNAAHARYLGMHRLLLTGRLDDLQRDLSCAPGVTALPLTLQVAHYLLVAQLAMRRLQVEAARTTLARAVRAARRTGIPALVAEVDAATAKLEAPAARQVSRGGERLLSMAQVESLLRSGALVVDGCRYVVRGAGTTIPLATRPVLLAIARTLAESWPADAPRDVLVRRAFRQKLGNESHRVRLRVEIGRLRRLLAPLCSIEATSRGFRLAPRRARSVVVLAPLVEDRHTDMLALLADGESWPTSALAEALDTSQRSVQRALESLALAGKVQPVGRGRTQRWMMPPLPGLATPLLLPSPLPTD